MIRCDYLLQKAATYVKTKLSIQANTTAFLINIQKAKIDFLSIQQDRFPEMDITPVSLIEASKTYIEKSQVLSSILIMKIVSPLGLHESGKTTSSQPPERR